MKYSVSSGLFVLRMVLGAVFIYHGVTKLMPGAAESMAGFIGGTFYELGLNFVSQAMWVTILGTIETIAGVLILLGLATRTAAVAIIVIMLGAMNVKGRVWPNIELDTVLAVTALALLFAGPGKASLDGCCGNGRYLYGYNDTPYDPNLNNPQATQSHQPETRTKTSSKKVIEHEVYEA